MIQPCMYVYPAGGMSLNMENHASKVPKKWIAGLTIPLNSSCSQQGNLVPQKIYFQDPEE